MATPVSQLALQSTSELLHVSADHPLVHRPPDPACGLIVTIPVRDESATIGTTLEALATQVDAAGRPVDPRTYEVIVLANNCRDDTVRIAGSVAERYPALAVHIVDLSLDGDVHVGDARRMAMNEAYLRLARLGKPRGIIATSDGDTRVAPTWIAATRQEIERGADAVGGRIRVCVDDLRASGATRLRYHLLDVGYRLLVAELESYLDPDIHDPWPRHFQHFGASMAVTADIYRRAGGLPARPYLEDVAFHDALVALDARIRHSPDVQVTTSARQSGRTTFGFAVQLEQWEAMDRVGMPFCVERAEDTETGIIARRTLRRLWQADRASGIAVQGLARHFGVPATLLADTIHSSGTFGALQQAVDAMQKRAGKRQTPQVDIRAAISDLRLRLERLRRESRDLRPLINIEPVGLRSQPGEVV